MPPTASLRLIFLFSRWKVYCRPRTTSLTDKFVDHLPVHRQLARFERAGIKFPYFTVIEWVSGASKLLEVLYNALKNELINSNYLHADETSIKVLDQDKSGKKIHTGFF